MPHAAMTERRIKAYWYSSRCKLRRLMREDLQRLILSEHSEAMGNKEQTKLTAQNFA